MYEFVTASRFRSALIAPWLLTLSLASTAVYAQQPSKIPVLIGFHRQPGPAEQALVRRAGGSIKYNYHLVPAIAATLPQNAIDALRRNPNVARIELDGVFHKISVTTESNDTWGVQHIGAGTVHTNGNIGANVKVAIIDSGIDHTHPQLISNYSGGYDFVNNDSDPMDDEGHGTHVAGTVAAVRDGSGVVGVAPAAKLYGLKVLNASGSGSFSDVIAALQWAVDYGIQVTNNSYGSSIDPGVTVKQAFDNSYAAGIIHIAAAGNSGNKAGKNDNVGYPAKYSSVVAVAATNSSNTRASWSSTGPDVEISAPGVQINSTELGGGYVAYSGTSMASPHVAGLAALIVGVGPIDTNSNGRTNDEVRQIIVSTAQDLGTVGRDSWYGHGLVNAVAAVAAVAPPPPTPAANVVSFNTDKTIYGSADTTAVLTAIVKDENNQSISGLIFSDFATTITPSGGSPSSPAVNFTESGTPGTYTGNLNLIALSADSYTVEVTATKNSVSGTKGSAGFTIQAAPTPATTQTIVTSAPNPSTEGQPATITATATIDGISVTEGTVTFMEGGTDLSGPISLNSSGQASFSTSALTTGDHVITAYYSGTTNFASSSGNVTHTVNSNSTAVSKVQAISYSTSGGRNNDRHLNITVTIVDILDNPLSGAGVSILIDRNNSLAATATGTTGSNGSVTFTYNNAPSGSYVTTVTGVTAAGFVWDGNTPSNSYPKP